MSTPPPALQAATRHPATSTSKAWFPALRRRPGARLQLFCFPFAGGGASAFRSWQDHLPPWVEPWALEYPGHETRFRESPVAVGTELAALIAEQISAAADLPFAFFGHSMGSLLAFETTRQLRRHYGLAPACLFVSGFSAPQLPPIRPPVRNLPEAAFREELRRYGGTPDEILADESWMQLLSPLLRCDLGLCETHVHTEQPGLGVPIVAFGGEEDPTVGWDRLLAWADQTNAGFRAHFFPGHHFFIKASSPRVCKLMAQTLEAKTGEDRLTRPAGDEAHLWVIDVDQRSGEVDRLRETLSADERLAADAFTQRADRVRYTVARAVLRDVLWRYHGNASATIDFSYSATGKPACAALRPLEFNVSHSGSMAVIGVAVGQAIGVDVEHIKEDGSVRELETQICSASELRLLLGVDSDHRAAAFFDLWVRKEAYLKRTGEGFTRSPTGIEVGLSPRFDGDARIGHAMTGTIKSFMLATRYAAAVATERPISMVTVRQWRPISAAHG